MECCVPPVGRRPSQAEEFLPETPQGEPGLQSEPVEVVRKPQALAREEQRIIPTATRAREETVLHPPASPRPQSEASSDTYTMSLLSWEDGGDAPVHHAQSHQETLQEPQERPLYADSGTEQANNQRGFLGLPPAHLTTPALGAHSEATHEQAKQKIQTSAEGCISTCASGFVAFVKRSPVVGLAGIRHLGVTEGGGTWQEHSGHS